MLRPLCLSPLLGSVAYSDYSRRSYILPREAIICIKKLNSVLVVRIYMLCKETSWLNTSSEMAYKFPINAALTVLSAEKPLTQCLSRRNEERRERNSRLASKSL